MSIKSITIAILPILLIAGCAQQITLDGFGDVTTIEEQVDLIKTGNTNIIPAPPIFGNSEFSVYFEVFNACQPSPERKSPCPDVEKVSLLIFNEDLCKIKQVGSANVEQVVESEGNELSFADYEGEGRVRVRDGVLIFKEKTLVAGSVEAVDLTVRAPETAFQHTCKLQYKVIYNGEAKTEITGKIINAARLRDLQRAGQPVTYSPQQNIGIGPIKMEFQYEAQMPLTAESTLPVILKIKNKGEGVLGNIAPATGEKKIEIKVPRDFSIDPRGDGKTCINDIFQADTLPENLPLAQNEITLSNRQTITVIRGESQPVKCFFGMPAVEVEKQFIIKGSMVYDYESEGSIDIVIKPTQQ